MNRRGFVTGLVSLLCAAPAVVSVASIMPIRAIRLPDPDDTRAILELLDRRIDEAHKRFNRNIVESLYGNHQTTSAIGIANLIGEPVKVVGIADAPFVRFGSYESIAPLIAERHPSPLPYWHWSRRAAAPSINMTVHG